MKIINDTVEVTPSENIILDYNQIIKYANNDNIIEIESDEYNKKIEEVYDKVDTILNKDKFSRQAIVTWMPNEKSNHCLSMVHVLRERNKNIMNVYIRSSDASKLHSDISFICILALKLGIEELRIFIGSLHIYLI